MLDERWTPSSFTFSSTSSSNCCMIITEDLELNTFPIVRSASDNYDCDWNVFGKVERDLKEDYLTLLGDRELSDDSKAIINLIFESFDSKVTKATIVDFIKNHFEGRKLTNEPKQYKEEKNIIISAFCFLNSQETDINKLSYEEIIKIYPEIAENNNFSDKQKKYLENYYFYLQVTLPLLKKKTKGILVDVPSFLEGSGNEYICGTRQSQETAARVILATKLGGLVFHERKGSHINRDEEVDDDYDDNGSNLTDSSSTKRRRI